MAELLIELFSEEIPARMQPRAADDLKRLMTDRLVEAGLTYGGAASFATPRRLTLVVDGLSGESPTQREERRGPRVDAPEKALDGFLRGAGMTRDQLQQREEKKGTFWYATVETKGRKAPEIVGEALEGVVRSFPWPKSMRWADGSLRWVRPLHSILCILSDEGGAEVVPLEIDGIRSGDRTRGHRFMAPDEFSVTNFEDYEAKLKRAYVVLSPDERAETIWHDAEHAAFAKGLEVAPDKGLLTEVAGLVEWPVTLLGEIAEEYRSLPSEVLKTSMKEHQKFFSVKNSDGAITHFATVANRETADHGATILEGNSRVLSARLADAAFFWENDLRIAKAGMEPWLKALEKVTFQSKLGSVADKIGRVAALAREIAPLVGADPDKAEKAARVAKADLASEMVYEFPELQGVMGEYYAQAAGLGDDVAAVAREHYQPLGPSDDVPSAPLSVAVALADKIETLTGFWAIDEKPTGSKDPFALRRAALGVIRLVLDNGLRLNLSGILRRSVGGTLKLLEKPSTDWNSAYLAHDLGRSEAGCSKSDNLLSFIHDRLKVHLRDTGVRHDVIDACLAMPNADDLTLLVARAEALQGLLEADDGENLVQGFRRANNILRQAEEADGVEYSFGAEKKLAETPEEEALFDALDAVEGDIKDALDENEFGQAMHSMAKLRSPIDDFFEAVQVNTDNQIVRRNRLNLLHRIVTVLGQVADLTKIEG